MKNEQTIFERLTPSAKARLKATNPAGFRALVSYHVARKQDRRVAALYGLGHLIRGAKNADDASEPAGSDLETLLAMVTSLSIEEKQSLLATLVQQINAELQKQDAANAETDRLLKDATTNARNRGLRARGMK